MTKLMTLGTTRRRLLAGGGAALLTSLGALRHASAETAKAVGPDYAVFSEMSPEFKLMKAGWNARVFTVHRCRNGNTIRCDFATGIVTVAPGTYHISGFFDRHLQHRRRASRNGDGALPLIRRLLPVAAGGREARGTPKNIKNEHPSVKCIGSGATANMGLSLFETYLMATAGNENDFGASSGRQSPQIYLRVYTQNSKWHVQGQDQHPPDLACRWTSCCGSPVRSGAIQD